MVKNKIKASLSIIVSVMVILVFLSFANNYWVAKQKDQQLSSLTPDEILSVEVDAYARGVFDPSGKPAGQSTMFVTTNRNNIRAFIGLLGNRSSKMWNHFAVTDYYGFKIKLSRGALTMEGRKLDSDPHGLWVQLSGNNGILVPGLSDWVGSAFQDK